MIRITPAARISLGLVFITISVILLGNIIGLIPSQSKDAVEARKSTAQSLAVQSTIEARNNNIPAISNMMDTMVESHPDILSVGLRSAKDGRYLTQTQDHRDLWIQPQGDESTARHWQVPIFKGDERWATMEISFTPLNPVFVLGYEISRFHLLLAFLGLMSFAGFLIFMRRALRHLDPTSVMPSRVKYALDTLTEGVIIVNTKGRIVLANTAFAEKYGCTVKALMGLKASALDWIDPETNKPCEMLPWSEVMSSGETQSAVPLNLYTKVSGMLTFTVNCASILDDSGKSRGSLATFADVTQLKKKNIELSEMLNLLRSSSEKIELQNKELEILATEDPLTGCLNRRAFFAKAEQYMAKAAIEEGSLACLMVDIDLFKSINDTYGHAVGDQVIQYVAMTLQAIVRGDDAVCRYGGEEFCLLLQDCDINNAMVIAERVRKRVEIQCAEALAMTKNVQVSASFGVSDLHQGAESIEELFNQADTALYRAKESGRNRVISWDSIKDSEVVKQPEGD